MREMEEDITGRLIARELKDWYIQDVNSDNTLKVLGFQSLIMAAFCSILGVFIGAFTIMFVVVTIPLLVFSVFIFYLSSKPDGLNRSRMKIYEKGFVPDERNEKRKQVFIFWYQVAEIYPPKGRFIGAPKIMPKTWYYTIITNSGTRCDLSSAVFPINKRKIIYKIIEKRRKELTNSPAPPHTPHNTA